jgi:secondary thiamine-phosphate synthase enzyme
LLAGQKLQIKTLSFNVYSKGNTDIIDITDEVQSRLKETGLRNGNVLVFAPGATAGITTIEYEPGLLKDYPDFFERIIPSGSKYYHDETWHDANGYAHVRASLQGASLTVPFTDAKLLLGTWQQIVLIDFDNRQRTRKIITQFMGE